MLLKRSKSGVLVGGRGGTDFFRIIFNTGYNEGDYMSCLCSTWNRIYAGGHPCSALDARSRRGFRFEKENFGPKGPDTEIQILSEPPKKNAQGKLDSKLILALMCIE